MNLFIRLFGNNRKKHISGYNRQLITSLDQFIQQAYWGEDLSSKEAVFLLLCLPEVQAKLLPSMDLWTLT